MSVKEAPEGGESNIQSSESERRGSARFAFSAIAEVMDRRSGARIAARISDISEDGCYVDSLSVFPSGTQVIVLIRHAEIEFKASATVVYALPSMGMGIRFNDVTPEMRPILGKWIGEVQGEFSMPFEAASTGGDAPVPESSEQKVLFRLLKLLMRKSLLSQTEGTALLEELLRER
jgi:hypothetical protein